MIVGALPGLTATMAVAVMVPLTFGMEPVTGLAVLGAIYMSAIYGGCFSAILINTPGTPGSIATCFDGYPMCVKGEGMRAIVGATVGSVIGGVVSLVALLISRPRLLPYPSISDPLNTSGLPYLGLPLWPAWEERARW